MSKSLKRVTQALKDGGLAVTPVETVAATTAQMAADAVNCALDQIAKSIIFRGADSDRLYLFITAGAQQVCPDKASALSGEPLGKADAAFIRKTTGFAIGGVSPIGHITPPVAFFDPTLLNFDVVWAAAGTPRHVFPIPPQDLLRLSQAATADFIA